MQVELGGDGRHFNRGHRILFFSLQALPSLTGLGRHGLYFFFFFLWLDFALQRPFPFFDFPSPPPL